jgi:hypothetical protein
MDEQIPLYETRSMLDVMAQMYPPTTHLRDTYFGRTKNHTTKHLDIDIVKGNRKVAISVNPRREGKTIDRLGYKTKSYTPPYFKEKKILTGQDLHIRKPGDTIYVDDGGLETAIAESLGEDLMDLEMRFTRAEELQASQLLQTGKCLVYEEVNGSIVEADEVDFGIDSANLVEVDTAWDDETDGNPVEDLITLMRLGARKSGLTMIDIEMGEWAAAKFRAHPRVKHYYDTQKLNIGSIEPIKDPDGSMIVGPFMGGIIREYPAYYVDPITGVELPYIDPYKVIVTTRNADFRRHYGLIEDVAAKVAAAVPRFPKIYTEDDPPALFLMLQSRFLLAPHQIDAIVCATVGEA